MFHHTIYIQQCTLIDSWQPNQTSRLRCQQCSAIVLYFEFPLTRKTIKVAIFFVCVCVLLLVCQTTRLVSETAEDSRVWFQLFPQ